MIQQLTRGIFCLNCRTDDNGKEGGFRIIWARFYSPKLKIEIKDIGDELNVAPQILDNLEKFFVRTRKKIRKEKARREAQKRIAAENKKMLS